MSAAVYDSAIARFATGLIDWEHDDIKVLLVSDDYAPSQTADSTRADVGRAEVRASGTYARGGMTLRGRSVSGSIPHATRLLAGAVSCSEFTGSFRYAVVYKAGGDDPLVAFSDLGHQVASNAKVTIEYDKTGGVCEFSIAPAI